MDALRRDKDRAGAFELVGVMCSNLIMGGCGCERCGSGVGMRGELIAARSSLVHGAARGVCRLLAVHGAVMRTVTPATCGQRDIVAQVESEGKRTGSEEEDQQDGKGAPHPVTHAT